MKESRKPKTIAPGRSAGVLLHITSLPSPFGIGDVGPSARRFADFLHHAKQKYWQLLPLSPTDRSQAWSPYSASSSMAGNPLLISPELLADDSFISHEEVQKTTLRNTGKVDYGYASKAKTKLLSKAYNNFCKHSSQVDQDAFESFVQKERLWLDDFALYTVIKKHNGRKPWFEWSADLKRRNPTALNQLKSQFKEELKKTKWLQFIFFRQWQSLRQYCNERQVSLFGDVPFYVGYDSADVWANKEIFALDEEGKMTGIAGVPPDYFNADGQLWGMPVFRWDILKATKYQWWIDRLSKNIELFDLVRLDHFRAFADYWEVPAGEATARNGTWRPGPGSSFFESVAEKIGKLPFVAEDLGDIDETVHQLRRAFALPGMKILQFAFGGDFPRSAYIPHNFKKNFIVYTGTHDNNTTRGWYRKDLDRQTRKNIDLYLGRKAHADNITEALIRMAFSSVARMAIIPMQDLLNLGETARMNVPASVKNNWLWRMRDQDLSDKLVSALRSLTELYNR